MILAAHSAGRSKFPACINGKDKTFFFVSYEGLRLTAPQAATVNYVPDLHAGMGPACRAEMPPLRL